MAFAELFNEYCDKLRCSNIELAKASNLDPSVISRYKSGKRVPASDSAIIESLSLGMQKIASSKRILDFPENVLQMLLESLDEEKATEENQTELFQSNFVQVMEELSITNVELAKYLMVDASYISRIRNKQRKPSDLNEFSLGFSNFIAKNYFLDNKKYFLHLLEVQGDELNSIEFISLFSIWLTGEPATQSKAFDKFLVHLDEFDLNDYIDAVHFNDIKVPTSPITFPGSKKYYGIKAMRTGTLDFLKTTVLSRNHSDVTIYNDMPMDELAKDVEFGKKWMMGLALIIKKGLHINCIHCIDRSFDELMLGLESWIPLYMTGQISPYYYTDTINTVFQHMLFISGSVALSGECMAGHQNDGMYYLTKKHEELKYYEKRKEEMLHSAKALMYIYRKETAFDYMQYRMKDAELSGDWKMILTAPSIYTIPESLLVKILNRNGLSKEEIKDIVTKVGECHDVAERILGVSRIHEIVPFVDKDEFDKRPILVHLADIFVKSNIAYTYDEYLEHLEYLEEYSETHERFSFEKTSNVWFKNMQIMIHEGHSTIVSKSNSPVINFVIEQPKLRYAFENMVMPVIEK